ncbi:MAG: peptidoglycan-binding protein [Firmicutes bacterium]|nr:peptidoglycan-binding protein [Bacillota bacterium]
MFKPVKVLKFGDKGPKVKEIQRQLALLGYEVGPVDGFFGLVTEEAVEALQRDHHIYPDGIVGPRTWSVLNSNTFGRYRFHLVKQGETLRSIAQAHQISPQVLATENGITDFRVTAGQRLKIPKRILLALHSSGEYQPVQPLFRHGSKLDAFITAGLALTAEKTVTGELCTRRDLQDWARRHRLPFWVALKLPDAHRDLEALLFTGKGCKKALSAMTASIKALSPEGLVIQGPAGLLPRHFYLYSRFLRLTRRAFSRQTLALTLPYPSSETQKAIDYSCLAQDADYLIFEPFSDSGEMGRSIRAALKEVPCWQMVIGLGGSGYDRELPQKVAFINKYNLGGACIFDFGREGESFWHQIGKEFISGEIIPARSS